MIENNIWIQIGNKCLKTASEMLDEKTAPAKETAETVEKLVSTAIAIDTVILNQELQNRFGVQVLQGQLSEQDTNVSG